MNQYRCETCKKPHKVPDGLSRQPHFFCCDEELPYDTAVVTTIRGCASHSDFQSGWDTVLDEVLQLPQRREQPNGSMYIYVNDVKALRQAGEP